MILAVEVETLAGLIASVATLITAAVGGWAILKQLRHTDSKVDEAAVLANQVYFQVNGAEDEPSEDRPATLGQTVRAISEEQQRTRAELAELRRELGTDPSPRRTRKKST